ncbi:HlyD family efflux transporter periplasmic adaptor subunit [Egbenema bharatensis]|uniref:HlyD family efflux transporter periplasmic adaptor subunit n=1 Tax=Egbenema bharatensis TaxID=3463334 RepID=UPI003A8A560B
MKQRPTPLPDHSPQETPAETNHHRKLRSRPPWQRLPKHWKKWLLYGALGFGAVVLLVTLFRPSPILVDTHPVQRGELQVTVDEEGRTRVRDRYTVAAGVNGHLERINLNEGDPIEQGQVVAQIDPLPMNTQVQEALGRLAEWRSERQGVDTQRPKPEAIDQARVRIQAAEANQRQAEARVAQSQAALEQAQRDAQRARELETAGVIPRQDREAAELNETTRARELDAAILAANAEASAVEVARAELAVLQQEQTDPDYLLRVYDARIASTEAELSRLRDRAARTNIYAPVSGRVLRIQQRSAQFVSEGTPLLEIGNVSQLELVIDVLSADAMRIRPGNPIWIAAGNSEPIAARVRLVEPSAFTRESALGVEEQRVNVIGDFVDAVNPNDAGFGDAYRVDAQIVVWESEDVLKVPLSALFRCEQSAWCTFVVEGDRSQQRQVEIGQRSHLEAEVLDGLQDGEVVILHPTRAIEDGSRVRGRDE